MTVHLFSMNKGTCLQESQALSAAGDAVAEVQVCEQAAKRRMCSCVTRMFMNSSVQTGLP